MQKKNYLYPSPPKILLTGFSFIILLGTALLMLPISSAQHNWTSFFDALFTATSATCVTGLSLFNIGKDFSLYGQCILLLLVQLGGIGFMTMSTWFAFLLGRKISLKERLILQESLNLGKIQGLVKWVRNVMFYVFILEAVGTLLYALLFTRQMPFYRALYYGLFHAVSAFNNSGYDLSQNFNSFNEYKYDGCLNLITMILIILGGLGFIVLADLFDFRTRKKLSLHSKVVLSVSGGLIGLGAVVLFFFEFTNAYTIGQDSLGTKIWVSLFQSITTRSAGMTTVQMTDMRQATQFFIVILMFIGASPGSMGGGIKTTTFAVLLGAIATMVRGKDDVVLFKFRIAKDQVYKAVTITLFCITIVTAGTMILATTENAAFLPILFEVTSAFGTVGLSLGLTPTLTLSGKLTLIFLMFIGRLGPLTLGYALGFKQHQRTLFRYAEGEIIIG